MPLLSTLPDIHIEDIPLHERILRTTRKYPENVALVDGETGEKYKFIDIRHLSQSIATSFYKRGFKKGDVLAIVLPNCPLYLVAYLGCAIRGGITTDELEHHFKDSGSKFILTSDNLLQTVLPAARSLGTQIKSIFAIKTIKTSEFPHDVTDFDEILRTPPNFNLPKVEFQTKTDIAWLPYSSGTTGPPKGVMLTHYNLSAIYATLANKSFFLWPTAGDSVVCFLPFFHIFGFGMGMISLIDGCQAVTIPKFIPQMFLQIIQDFKIGMIHVVPPVALLLAKHPIVSKYDLTSLKTVVVGAAPLGKELSEELMIRLPNLKFVLQMYGMTEYGGSHHMLPLAKDQMRHGSVGVLLSNFECKIVDPDTGKELEEPNKRGEICLRSVTIMAGYLNRQEETEKTIDSEGWLHTGDIGYYDEDEFFYVVDRLKELIKVKGFQVPPAELESLLLTHPDVQDAAVIGIPDERAGELPKAFIVRKPNCNTSAEDFQLFVKEKSAPYKQLEGGVEFLTEIPKSPSGKILRRLLKQVNEKSKL